MQKKTFVTSPILKVEFSKLVASFCFSIAFLFNKIWCALESTTALWSYPMNANRLEKKRIFWHTRSNKGSGLLFFFQILDQTHKCCLQFAKFPKSPKNIFVFKFLSFFSNDLQKQFFYHLKKVLEGKLLKFKNGSLASAN